MLPALLQPHVVLRADAGELRDLGPPEALDAAPVVRGKADVGRAERRSSRPEVAASSEALAVKGTRAGSQIRPCADPRRTPLRPALAARSPLMGRFLDKAFLV